MKTIIHINQLRLKDNTKNGTSDPVITTKNYKTNLYANRVELPDGCTVVYSPHDPLKCGARCWIETKGKVIFPNGAETFEGEQVDVDRCDAVVKNANE